MISTYENFVNLAKLYKGGKDDVALKNNFKLEEERPLVIAYVYCTHFGILNTTANKFFGITDSDKASFIVLEIVQAIEDFDCSKGTKLISFINRYAYNRLRAETQKAGKFSKKVITQSHRFEEYEEADRDLNLSYSSDEYSRVELVQAIELVDLSQGEKAYCELIIENKEVLRDSEAAQLLGKSRAGVGHIRRSLRAKLSPIFMTA